MWYDTIAGLKVLGVSFYINYKNHFRRLFSCAFALWTSLAFTLGMGTNWEMEDCPSLCFMRYYKPGTEMNLPHFINQFRFMRFMDLPSFLSAGGQLLEVSRMEGGSCDKMFGQQK